MQTLNLIKSKPKCAWCLRDGAAIQVARQMTSCGAVCGPVPVLTDAETCFTICLAIGATEVRGAEARSC